MMSDLISRQAAIDAVAEGLNRTFVKYRDVADKMLSKVPSAEPMKPGHWILKKVDEDEYGNEQFNYICSECGAPAYEFSQPYCHRCGAQNGRGRINAKILHSTGLYK